MRSDNFSDRAIEIDNLADRYREVLQEAETVETPSEFQAMLWQLSRLHEGLVREHYALAIAVFNEAEDRYVAQEYEAAERLLGLLARFLHQRGPHSKLVLRRLAHCRAMTGPDKPTNSSR